ncbi:MAG: glycosyltransferase family 9 protein [Chloroflexi bacterium]|nr:glycosyltransferase family 9 protein [Chloroflexota bacterium]
MTEPLLVPATIRRILVIRLGAIGDMVITLPALQALRRSFSDAWIDLVANPIPASFVVGRGLVDRFAPYDVAVAAGIDSGRSPNEQCAGGNRAGAGSCQADHYDLAVLWVGDPRAALLGRLAELRWRHAVVCDPLGQAAGGPLHAADRLLASIGAMDRSPAPAQPAEAGPAPSVTPAAIPRFFPTHAERVEARGVLNRLGLAPGVSGRRLIAIHPGSGGARKNWPAERFAAVADALLRRGESVLIVAGPADGEAVGQVERRLWQWRRSDQLAQIPLLPLPVLAATLEQADAYLGNDSGVSHLAAAAGTPTVAIFGPTDPAIWAPRGRRVRVLRFALPGEPAGRQTADQAEVAEVMRALDAALDVAGGPYGIIGRGEGPGPEMAEN